ncbi:MAG TPA: transposase [Trebonia sp.]
MSGKPLRTIAVPFVAAAPAGARVRTRLRLTGEDAAVLRAVGGHMGSLAGRDLAARCREGRLDAAGRAVSRRDRKRALTRESSSRWAGAITRTSEDQWQLGDRNLRVEAATLRARVRAIETRSAVPAGQKRGRVRGYATAAERHGKLVRAQCLRVRLARVEQRIEAGAVSVVRGGRRLLRNRANLTAAGLTEAQWRERWDAERLFLTADGEAGKAQGNETIRWNPDEGWLEVKLPGPLEHMANRPHGRYRLCCPVAFAYRGDEVAAQTASGAVRYDISLDAATGRWYLDASWKTPARPVPPIGDLRHHPVIAVDVNAGHLAVAAVAPDGNVLGSPWTVPLDLAGLPAATRDGRLRAAISGLIAAAKARGAKAVVIEDLDFAEARSEGRERAGNRPSRGKRGGGFRRAVAGIPTAKFRARLTQMTANAGLAVIAVDPAYTSRWGAQHWLPALREHHPGLTGHHAASLVIGRRALGHRARRRGSVPAGGQRTARRRTAPRAPAAGQANSNGGTLRDARQPPPWRKTAPTPGGPPARPGSPRPFGANG